MGIFQLIDYVGLDVVQFILRVMQPHMQGEKLHNSLLDEFILTGVRGGQYSDGSQKDGFLKYEKGKPVGVIDSVGGSYLEINTFGAECDAWLGNIPAEMQPWKILVKAKDKASIMKAAFKAMEMASTEGSKLALAYAQNSRKIAQKLVSDGVAHNENDVNTVLLTGFFHAYGPINDYL
jgi:3-hydroxyacyl-CoA dehydrogenase